MSNFELTAKQSEILEQQLTGDARHVLLYGGSRSGKTFLLVWAICNRALMAPGSRHVIFRRHGVAVKQAVAMDTLPEVMRLAFPEYAGQWKWHDRDGYFSFDNGSEIWLAGLEDKERVDKILGKQFATIFFNEASEIAYSSYTVAVTRLAQMAKNIATGENLPQRVYCDLNPTTRLHWTYRLFVDGVNPDGGKPVNQALYAVNNANPTDNLVNLSQDYIDSLNALPERVRRRFFLGEYTADSEDALWRRSIIKTTWQDWKDLNLTRVVVAIDPAVSNEPGSDETGIIAAGVAEGIGYVLADASGKYSPEEWARQVIALAVEYDADCIVAERNQGGDMVASTIRAQQRDMRRVKLVTATKGKVTRAEPISALYERGKVYHVGDLDTLAEQMCSFTIDFDRRAQGYSPDRVDALVWALTELFGVMTRRKSTGPIDYPKLASIA